jgi:xylulokinase
MRCTPRRVLSALIWAFVLVSLHLFTRELTEPSSSSSSSSANRDDQQFDPDNPPLYIGLDMSTQSLKVTVLSAVPAEDRPGELVEVSVVRTASLNFDEDLPRFMTHGGVHRNGTTVTSPPLMWVTALDVLLGRVGAEDSTVDLSRVVALSASGQQHGSVFWSIGASDALGSLDPSRRCDTRSFPSLA